MALTRINNNSLSSVTAAGLPTYEGQVLQVKEVVKTDAWDGSANARVFSGDVTGLSVTITPKSASNKLLVMASVAGANGVSSYRWGYSIYRDGSPSDLIGDSEGGRTSITVGRNDTVSSTLAVETRTLSGVVPANSTSSTTFSIRILNNESSNGTVYVNRSSQDANENYTTRSVSSLIVMEIAGA
jgi:hypothetical protein